MRLLFPGHRFELDNTNHNESIVSINHLKVSMTLDYEEPGEGLKLVPGTQGMDVPSACTIVIIAGSLTSTAKFL